MDAVVDPAATRLNKLSCRNRRGMPEHSDEVTLAARLDAQDTKAVLLVVNPFDEPGQNLGDRVRCRSLGIGICVNLRKCGARTSPIGPSGLWVSIDSKNPTQLAGVAELAFCCL